MHGFYAKEVFFKSRPRVFLLLGTGKNIFWKGSLILMNLHY